MLFADTETLVLGLSGIVASLAGIAIQGIIALLIAKLSVQQAKAAVHVAEVAEKQEAAAVAANEVKAALAESTTGANSQLDALVKVGEATHMLVNSAMEEQKRLYAVKCRAAADDNPSSVNLAEADAAEAVYEEHKAKQAKMDQEGGA